jgi:hypothetical protein
MTGMLVRSMTGMLVRSIVAVAAIGIAVSGCHDEPTAEPLAAPPSKRDLTDTEKTALAGVMSQRFKDPGSAQFKWMPVVLTKRNGVTDYCGLVNSQNPHGEYVGFTRFYAQLTEDANGQFTTGILKLIENNSPTLPIELDGLCKGFGYSDFGQAN